MPWCQSRDGILKRLAYELARSKMIEDNEVVSKSSEERLIAKFLDERMKGPKSGKSQCWDGIWDINPRSLLCKGMNE